MRSVVATTFVLIASLACASARAQVPNSATDAAGHATAEQLDERAGVDEHLGERFPTDVVFRDQDGAIVQLGDLFDGERPVVLTFAYHSCPMLCDTVLDGVVKSLGALQWRAGEQYDFVNISFDPNDTVARAAAKRERLATAYLAARPGEAPVSSRGFRFLTGDAQAIQRATGTAGFRYFWDEAQQQFAHSAVMVLVSPDGRIARYLYGIEFRSEDVRFGLLEASEGRQVSSFEHVLRFCYAYDPNAGRYTLLGTRVMQAGGALVAALLALVLGSFWVREIRRSRRATSGADGSIPARNLPRAGGEAAGT